jgi:NADPH-dependent curcumin reductase CurA
MTTVNRQFLLNSRPVGNIKATDFLYHEAPVPDVQDGQVLVRQHYIAVEPAQRGWMEDRVSYVEPIAIGGVMRAFGLGEIVVSKNPDYPVGSRVTGLLGWQDYALADTSVFPLQFIDDDIDPETQLGVCGVTGLTAYFGMDAIGKPETGETVVISGAAGATGSIAGQIAKLAGCRVIGIAGSDQKCDWLCDVLGFDEAINYKTENVAERIAQSCPQGLDIFWDNVGGEILDIALENMALNARIVLCGGISRYNSRDELAGPKNYFNLIIKRSRMEGLLVSDYASRFPEAISFFKEKLASGELKHTEDVLEGFDRLPEALMGLFSGENTGKRMVRIVNG